MEKVEVLTFERASCEEDYADSARLFTQLDPWVTYGRTFAYSLRKVKDPEKELYVAKLDGAFTGAVLLSTKGALAAYLQSIAVEPSLQGRGLGMRLLRKTEERVFAEFPNLFLTVGEFRPEAIALYRKAGYEEVGLFRDYILPGVHEILMRKTVGPSNSFYAEKKQK